MNRSEFLKRQNEVSDWLIGPARVSCTPEQIVAGLADKLKAVGMPLWRIRMGQSVANPMISAWGVVWTRESGVTSYTIERRVLSTEAYFGSPFERVIGTRSSYHVSLERLDKQRAHVVLLEQAAAGGTGYLALPIGFGDGSLQVSAFVTNSQGGFLDWQVEMLEALAPAMGAAIEPAAMRHSTQSLLEVYLGDGPSRRIVAGEFRRGQTTNIDAAVVLTDLRDFTGLSERSTPEQLLERLGSYFEKVVDAIKVEGGDVLKFIGDGVLSVFPADSNNAFTACKRAAAGIRRAFAEAGDERFVAALHFGPVVYGNIGSPDRLDFTVVGPTVNYLSRLEGVAKAVDAKAVCSADVAAFLEPGSVVEAGMHSLKGISEPQRVFELLLAD